MSYRTPSRFVFASFLLMVLVVEPQAVNAGTTRNLLVNGDAEQTRSTDDWTAQASVLGWRVTRGAVSVLCYSAFTLSGEQPLLPKNESPGRALFGAPGADTAMEQTVDISAAASAVDAEGAVPKGTRRIDVTVQFVSGATSYHKRVRGQHRASTGRQCGSHGGSSRVAEGCRDSGA